MLLIATQAFSKWVMLLDFKWNQDYIAQNLCENKAKPILKCEGNCQLTKMMAAEEKDTAPSNKSTRSALAEVLFSFEPIVTALRFPASKKRFIIQQINPGNTSCLFSPSSTPLQFKFFLHLNFIA